MSWQERDYYRADSGGGGMPGIGFPKPTPLVTKLLIANVVFFVLTAIARPERIYSIGALLGVESGNTWQIWRLITYQFLHGGPWHLFMNMLGLYFFGPPLERTWGAKRFIVFYLACGVIGGLAYLSLSAITTMPSYLIGASGAVLGLLAACAMLFPRMIIILIIFPMPIRMVAALLVGVYVLNILWSGDLADACHLGGMICGFAYVRAGPWYSRFKGDLGFRYRQKLREEEKHDQQIVDKILEKIHLHGMGSLTRREKQMLKKATERQQQREKFLRK